MSTYTLLRFLHILSAIWFIAGILGRQLVMAAASSKAISGWWPGCRRPPRASSSGW